MTARLATDRESFETQLADCLVDGGALDANALARARHLVDRGEGERLEAVLCRLGLVDEAEMAGLVAELGGFTLAEFHDYPTKPVLPDRLTAPFLRQAGILPLSADESRVVVAMVDPFDEFARRALEMTVGREVEARVAVPAMLEAAHGRLYKDSRPAAMSALGDLTMDGGAEDLERLRDQASEAPVVKLVNALVTGAVEARASDIHVEPMHGRLRIRYRVDGILREMDPPPAHLAAAIVSRIKIMARLDIAERRLPQDGRIRLAVRGREVDLRVATSPTIHGECVVLRVLDRGGLTLDFDALGFTERQKADFETLLRRPNGILLVTGPTGSGKSTTLYTSLKALNEPGKKLIAIEDPVEYQLDGINQIHVQPRIGLTFATLLRSILRQDPDIIMVGEIRDLETARIATQAALTGHLVLSTLHTNTAAAATTRLLDMGVEPYLLTSTVVGAVGQRLVRTLCPECRAGRPATRQEIQALDLNRFSPGCPPTLYSPRGCEACGGAGYRGRSAILEILPMSEGIRQRILDRAEAGALHAQAVAEGMSTLYDDGLRKALDGVTTIEEVFRVTREL